MKYKWAYGIIQKLFSHKAFLLLEKTSESIIKQKRNDDERYLEFKTYIFYQSSRNIYI